MAEAHINLEQISHMERAQQALANQSKLDANEVKFVQDCIVDLSDDGQLENHRHYTILRNVWKKALGLRD